MTVWLSRMKCENGHTMLAVAAEMEGQGAFIGALEDLVRRGFDVLWESGRLGPCRVCDSRDFHVETCKTAYRSIEETKPEIERAHALQARDLFLRRSRN
jgi:hypothetical protein